MDSLLSRRLTVWSVRSHRFGAPAIGLGFGILVMIMAPAYVAAANTVAGGLAAMAAAAQPLAESFQFLTGPVDRLDTVGGYLSYKIYPDIALLVAIYAALQGSQAVRGLETRGLFDLWSATGLTRSAILRSRLTACCAALAGTVVVLYICTAIGGVFASETLVASAIGQCVAIGALGIFSYALALLASQFFSSARITAGTVNGYLVAGFFVANLDKSLGWFKPLRYLSPFYYYNAERTLAGIGFSVTALLVLLVAAAVMVVVAERLLLRRDIGGVSVTARQRVHPVDHAFHPTRFWRRSLWISWIRDQPIGLISWVTAVAVFAGVESAIVPTAMRLIDTGNGSMREFLAARGGLLTADQYLSAFLTITTLILAGCVVTQVARWAGDSNQHRTDALLIQPISMWRLLVERTVALLVVSGLVSVAALAGTYAGTLFGGYSVDALGLLRCFAVFMLLCFAVGGVGLLATVLLRSAAATAVTAGALVACFFLTIVSELLRWPAWTMRPSLFDAVGTPYLTMPSASRLVYLAALGCAGLLAAYGFMRRGFRIVA